MTSGKKRTYGVLMILGLAALLVDRVLLGGAANPPQSAHASTFAMSPLESTADIVETRPVPVIPFPALPDDDTNPPARDLFARPGPWRPQATATTAAAASGNAPPGRESFATRATLMAVMVTGQGSMAVVNGLRLTPGDSVNGCRLLRVFGRSARFACADGEVDLFIATPSLRKGN